MLSGVFFGHRQDFFWNDQKKLSQFGQNVFFQSQKLSGNERWQKDFNVSSAKRSKKISHQQKEKPSLCFSKISNSNMKDEVRDVKFWLVPFQGSAKRCSALNALARVRFPGGPHRRLESRYLRSVQPRARRWWEGARERFARGVATGNARVVARWPTAPSHILDDAWPTGQYPLLVNTPAWADTPLPRPPLLLKTNLVLSSSMCSFNFAVCSL